MKRVIAGVATALAATLAVSACGGGDPLAEDTESGSSESITIGSANFPESALMAEIYAQALEAKGVSVTRRPDLGSREKYMDGLKDGSIDLIPEYTGSLLQFLDPQTKAAASEEVYTELQTKLPDNLIVLEKAVAENKDAVVVTKETADKWNLKSIEDLAPHCGEVVFGGPPEFQTRAHGIPGIQAKYNCTFKSYSALEPGAITTKALKENTVQAADIFTTDASIEAEGFVVLEDPKSNFTAENLLPLINKDKASDTVKDALDAVSAKLDQESLNELNVKLNDPSKPEYSDIAKDWLAQAGL